MDSVTTSEMALRGRIGAAVLHATHDSRETSAAGRAAFLDRFEREVDPERALAPEERQKRARSAKSAYFSRLSLKALRARRVEQLTTIGQAERAVAEMIGYRLSEHAPNPRGERSIGQPERAEAEEIGYDWLDRVQGMRLVPGDLAARLHNLAELCDLAQEHPEYVQPGSGLRWVRDRLRALAQEVGE